jgi:hypothetical protein
MPKEAKPWNSDYLLPGESFSVSFIEEGVYDYYCIPHEQAGMVGRIVVGAPETHGWLQFADADGTLPPEALEGFPAVQEIMAKGTVRHVQAPR